MKSGYTTITLNIEDRQVSMAMHQYQQQSQISIVQIFYSTLVGSTGCSLL